MALNPKLAFQVSPLWFTGPPIGNTPLPIIAITDTVLFKQAATGIVTPIGQGGIGSDTVSSAATAQIDLDNAFGAFQVMPGGTLIKVEVAQYPFANQKVAANATIFQPLEVSLLWDVPMRSPDAWNKKLSTITALQSFINYHNNNGGTFMIVTPSFIYENMLLVSMADSSRSQSPIPQNAWRFDFQKPLIMLDDLTEAQNALMNKLTNGSLTDGSWTGTAAGLGSPVTLPQFTIPGTMTLPVGPGGVNQNVG